MKPRIYLAGKIAKNDFRHKLVPELRGTEWPGSPIECKDFIYCGPFFANCDHGCSHGPTRHGVVSDWPCQGQSGMTDGQIRDQVIVTNNNALEIADVVFAYITCLTAYGTLVELGAAYATNKQVVLILGQNLHDDHKRELWYAIRQADAVYQNVAPEDVVHIVQSTCWDMAEISW